MTKALILDANILIRGVLGTQVATLLAKYAAEVSFLTVEEAFEDAGTYIPAILRSRGANEETLQAALAKLSGMRRFISIVPVEDISHLEGIARKRLRGQDEDDWPYLALALLLNAPIWTEDTDFFGVGVATWTSRRIEGYFEADDEAE